MDESTSPAQCSAIAQLQVSIKWVISSTGRCSCVTKTGLLYTPGCVAVLAASVKMRIVNDAGRCFACSDADQDEVKTTTVYATVWVWVMMTMQIDSYTVAGDWCTWLIRESVRPTQWPWPAADMRLPAHSDCDSCQCLYMSSSLSMFFFLLQVYYWLGSGSGHYSWAQAPYPRAPCTLTTFCGTVHACICTKDKNNFLVTFFAIVLICITFSIY